jgi:hypothetical protein
MITISLILINNLMCFNIVLITPIKIFNKKTIYITYDIFGCEGFKKNIVVWKR